nr:MAG TPA: hypothetical protein [Caudoviricetes sp.]
MPIGKLYTTDNLFEVGKYPATEKKKKMISSYACEYAFVPLKTSKK